MQNKFDVSIDTFHLVNLKFEMQIIKTLGESDDYYYVSEKYVEDYLEKEEKHMLKKVNKPNLMVAENSLKGKCACYATCFEPDTAFKISNYNQSKK